MTRPMRSTVLARAVAFALAAALLGCSREAPDSGVGTGTEPPVSPTAAAADWPSHRGDPGLRGISAGRLGRNPTLAWKYETKGPILASPVIAGGVVYIGSGDGALHAVELATGKGRWTYPTELDIEAPALVHDGRVYVGSTDGNLYALEAESGKEVWRFTTENKIIGAPNVYQGKDGSLRILVGSYDANLYCLDARTGKGIWTYETDHYLNGTPAVLGQEIVFGGCDAVLHVVSAETGERVRTLPLGTGCHVVGSVGLADGMAFFGHHGSSFLCVDLESGEIRWTFDGRRRPFLSSPAVGEEHVVFGGEDRQLHCLTRSDGEPRWAFPTRRTVNGSPVISGDQVLFGSGDGRVYLVALEDGEERWSYDIGAAIESSPAVVEGWFVVSASDGWLYAFRADPAVR